MSAGSASGTPSSKPFPVSPFVSRLLALSLSQF
jgi:hypothetical protein